MDKHAFYLVSRPHEDNPRPQDLRILGWEGVMRTRRESDDLWSFQTREDRQRFMDEFGGKKA